MQDSYSAYGIGKRNGKDTFFKDQGDGFLRTVNGYTASEVVDALRQRDDTPIKAACGMKKTIVDLAMWAALQHEAVMIVQPVDGDALWEKANTIFLNTIGSEDVLA